jgi:pyruvate/oxaloacetate carboxyltransferase
MYSNLVSQLKEQNSLDKLDDVLREVPLVRKEMGYPPLVTPRARSWEPQATVNVLVGKTMEGRSQGSKNVFPRLLRTSSRSVDPEIEKLVIGEESPHHHRPGEKLEPEMAAAREIIAPFVLQPRDVLKLCPFPSVAKDFLMLKYAREMKRDLGFERTVEECRLSV